ncbi:MAG: hypothetical protein HOC17_03345 [Candidatus Ruthia sp.]|jgi:uncharacterized membrane protein|nr:hypothetical protein [Candidatus Ruthturnera sp.]
MEAIYIVFAIGTFIGRLLENYGFFKALLTAVFWPVPIIFGIFQVIGGTILAAKNRDDFDS